MATFQFAMVLARNCTSLRPVVPISPRGLQICVPSMPSTVPSPSVSLLYGSVSPSRHANDTHTPFCAPGRIEQYSFGAQPPPALHEVAHEPSMPSKLRSSLPSLAPSLSESLSM